MSLKFAGKPVDNIGNMLESSIQWKEFNEESSSEIIMLYALLTRVEAIE